MRASHRVSTFHRRFSTGLIPNPLPTAHHCRVVPPTAVTVYCTKGYCTKGEIETKKVEQSKPQCKKPKSRFYAVLVGREGPKIYLSWKQCEPNVVGYSGVSMKGFRTFSEAEAWHMSRLVLVPRKDDRTNSSTNSQVPKNQEDPLLISATQSVERGALTTDGNLLNGELIKAKLSPLLSDEQRHVIELARQGKSFFFTGSAGTGKSFTLRELIRVLREDNAGNGVYVTASTGIAAVNIGGSTLHSYAGIGIGKGPALALKLKALRNRYAAARWDNTKILVIDEISMVDGQFFDKLEEIARYVRGNERPFGGIQLIICGDFFQLPPVPDTINGLPLPITFAFDSKKWSTCIQETITLTKVYRQQEGAFVDLLNSMRYGVIPPRAHSLFASLERDVQYGDGIEPVKLFSLRAQVAKANFEKLSALEGNGHVYEAKDFPGHDIKGRLISAERASELADQTLAVRSLTLKVGAQVMLIMNMPGSSHRLVNGTLGVVTGFKAVDERKWPVVRFMQSKGEFHTLLLTPLTFEVVNGLGTMEAQRDQLPLILAWAMSIHKSQGQTLPRVKVDLSGVFEKGQAYVAISRATSVETLQVLHFHPSKVLPHPRVVEWSSQLRQVATTPQIAADAP